MFQSICYSILAIMTMNSCSAAKPQQTKLPVEKIDLKASETAGDKIVFLTFRITITDSLNDQYDIKLINKIIADGSLKKNAFSKETVIEPNYLYYQVTGGDTKGNDKHFERVENPLARTFEYTSEDGKLAKKTIKTSTGELAIRFQYDQNSKSISIFKPDQQSAKLKPIYHAIF